MIGNNWSGSGEFLKNPWSTRDFQEIRERNRTYNGIVLQLTLWFKTGTITEIIFTTYISTLVKGTKIDFQTQNCHVDFIQSCRIINHIATEICELLQN